MQEDGHEHRFEARDLNPYWSHEESHPFEHDDLRNVGFKRRILLAAGGQKSAGRKTLVSFTSPIEAPNRL